jgi:recombination protein RecT
MSTKAVEKKSETKAVTPIENLRSSMNALQPEFQKALPPHVSVEKFIRVVMTALQQTPALVQCDRHSLFAAILKAAADGLLPDGRESVVLPYKEKKTGRFIAQYLPMVGGILKKIRNSGEIASMTSQIFFEKDRFRYWVDENGEHIEHEPEFLSDRGEPVGAYALAKTKHGDIYVEIMTKDQIMAVRNVSRAKDTGPWSGDFESEMWRKSVVRRLAKRLPSSTDVVEMLKRDDDNYDFDSKTPDKEKPAASGEPSRLLEALESTESEKTPEAESEAIDAPIDDPFKGPEDAA